MSKKKDLQDVEKLSEDLKNPFEKYQEEIDELRRENYTLRSTMEQYGIDEVSIISDIEYICIRTIQDLRKLADTVGLNEQDTKILDTVHRNLRRARGDWEKKELKGKDVAVEDLLRIVEGNGSKAK